MVLSLLLMICCSDIQSRVSSRRNSAVNVHDVKISDSMDLALSDEDNKEDTQSFLASLDVDDLHNELTFAEYANDIYAYMRSSENLQMASPQYMSRQRDINARMREILVDWLIEVHLKFKLEQETLYLTINIIDRFLERRAVTRDKLQLVGCAAMLLASKYEEIYAPEVRDFVYISDQAYTREQILAMETIMLNALEFNLTIHSPLKFADRYLRVIQKHNNDRFKFNVYYLLELTNQEYSFVKYNASLIATAAVFIAGRVCASNSVARDKSYSPILQRYTQYSPEHLKECLSGMWALLMNESNRYRAVRSKYSSSKFQAVARADFTPAYSPLFEHQAKAN